MAENNPETFAERLRQIRLAHGLTQQQVADSLGVHRSTYTYYERGHTNPPRETLEKLVKLFHVPYESLLGALPVPDASATAVCVQSGAEDPYAQLQSASREQQLIALFRAMDPAQQQQALETLRAMQPDSPDEPHS